MRELERIRFEDIDLEDSTFRSRLDFNERKIESLADDIKEFGQRNPIGLREVEGKDKLQVIYGWNRIFAIKQNLGMDEINALNHGRISDLDTLMHNISDNIKHEDLTTLEIAYQVSKLRENYDVPVKRISEIYEDKTQYIYDLLTLTKMQDEIKNAVHLGDIGLTHAIEINKHPVSNQLEILRQTIKRGLTLSQIKQRRQPKETIVKKSAKERITQILIEAMREGEDVPDMDYKALQTDAIESELERIQRFLITQIVPQSYLHKSAPPKYGGEDGWTRESVVRRRVDYYRYLINEGLTLPELIDKLNYDIYRILEIRLLNDGYRVDRDEQDPWWSSRHIQLSRGFRLDRLTDDEDFWVMVEAIRLDDLRFPCEHKYSYDEEYGDDVCDECCRSRSYNESPPIEWEEPPYEEPPAEETYIEIGFSNQLEKSKEE